MVENECDIKWRRVGQRCEKTYSKPCPFGKPVNTARECWGAGCLAFPMQATNPAWHVCPIALGVLMLLTLAVQPAVA